MCINSSFFTFIFAVLLPVLSRHILSFSMRLQRFLENEHKAEVSSAYNVKLLEIRALWSRARWASREEHLSQSNYIGFDSFFSSLGQICTATRTSRLSACGVSMFLAELICTS